MKKLGVLVVLLFFISGYTGTIHSLKSPGNLCYYPDSHNFGYKKPGEKDSTTFEIWACCGCAGSITYHLIENCDWVEVSPESGTSYGEKDTITVEIDTTGLSEGEYVCPIKIESNNGDGVFTVRVRVANDEEPPHVRIVEPQRGWLYWYGERKTFIGLSMIIGKATIEVEAEDDKTGIDRVEIYIGNQLVKTDYVEPYTYQWIEPGFGVYVVKAIAYDGFSNEASSSVLVWKFL